MCDSQTLPRRFQFGTDQQRFSRPNHIFGKCIAELAGAFGKNAIVPDLQLEAYLFHLLERDVEMTRVENLSELGLYGAQDFILIQARADRLPDLGQQLVFLRAPVCVVTDDVIFECESKLQSQPDHQVRTGRAKGAPLGMRK